MTDRTPTKPGRVRLVPVTGQTNLYDMTMADDPTEVGTPLNKANLLSDAAVAAVWPNAADRPSDPTVSDAFENLGAKHSAILAHYVTNGTSASRETEIFTLSEPIENFDQIEVWGYFPTQPSAAPLQFYIDVGAKTQAASSQTSDWSERLSTIKWAGTTSHNYAGHSVTLFADNMQSGHTALIQMVQDTSSNSYIEIGTSAAQLSGTSVYVFVASGSQNRVTAGAHIIIIGTKF